VEPPALRIVKIDAILGAAGETMQRQTCLLSAQIPERGVDGRERD
jgi:hypothetical protein